MKKLFFVAVILIAIYALVVQKGESTTLEASSIKPYYPEKSLRTYNNVKLAFSAKRTYAPNEAGLFNVASECDDPEAGCVVETKFSFKAPKDVGMYWVEGVDEAQKLHRFPISVVNPGVKKACLLVSSFTEQAYSRQGGKSFYSTPYTAPITLSLNRPILNPGSNTHGYIYPSVKFLQDLGVGSHIFDDLHLHNKKIDLIENCKYLILESHSEYWTQSMLEQISGFVQAGNDVANFSSNFGYWLTQMSEDQKSITVDKTKVNIKQNRLDKKHSYIRDMLGMYYIGYPVSRYAGDEQAYKEKYPLLSKVEELNYKNLRSMRIEDSKHPAFSCIKEPSGVIPDIALRVEVDGKLLREYRKGKLIPKNVAEVDDVDGALLTAWAVYGKHVRHIVVGRDFNTPYGGRVISFGSIGWLNKSLTDETTRDITMNVLALFEGKQYECPNTEAKVGVDPE